MPSLLTLSAENPDISCPEKTMLPFVGFINPVRQLKSVVLPAPFGPDDTQDGPVLCMETHLFDRPDAAKVLGEGLNFQRIHSYLRKDPGV